MKTPLHSLKASGREAQRRSNVSGTKDQAVISSKTLFCIAQTAAKEMQNYTIIINNNGEEQGFGQCESDRASNVVKQG